MAFCTRLDVRAALAPGASEPESTEATAVNLPDWQVDDAIAEAASVVMQHVASRYTIPEPDTEVFVDPTADPAEIETVPMAPYPVRGWTRNVAAYLLTLTFKRNKDVGEDDPIRLRYIMTMRMLEAVRNRTLDLPGLEPITTNQGVHVENLYKGKLFGPEDFLLTQEGVVSTPGVLWPLRAWGHGA